MATESKLYKSEDWKLWTYQPQPGSFVLDFSQLDGSDVLGNGSDGLAVSQYDVAEVNITSGGEVDSGVIHPISPTIANITVNVKDFTTEVMNDFYVGTGIFLSVDSPTPFANPYAYMFYGVIDSANVSVIPGEDYSTITIQARSYSSLQLNSDVGLTKNESTVKSTLISTAAATLGNFVDLDTSAYNFKGTARESKSLGDWLTDLALCDFMQMRDTYFPVYVYQYDFADPSTWFVAWQANMRFRITKNTSTSVGTLGANEITDVQLDWSGAGSPTGVTLTNYTDSEIVYEYGSTTAGAGGSVSFSSTVDVKDLTQMTEIGQQLLAMNKAFKPIQITTTTATNNQSLVWKDVSLLSTFGGVTFFYSPDKLYDIGDTITIDLPEFGVDEVDMIITGREINVDPDNWTTTYTLWKGFTN
jgi:hypothetical protein